MIKAFKDNWKHMFNIAGRENTTNFWWFVVDNAIFWILYCLIQMMMWRSVSSPNQASLFLWITLIMIALATPLVMSLSTSIVRRMHDVNVSGWWFWLILIPFIGWVIIILVVVMPAENKNNRFDHMTDFKWWKKWWAWLFLVLLFIGLLIFFYYFALGIAYFTYG